MFIPPHLDKCLNIHQEVVHLLTCLQLSSSWIVSMSFTPLCGFAIQSPTKLWADILQNTFSHDTEIEMSLLQGCHTILSETDDVIVRCYDCLHGVYIWWIVLHFYLFRFSEPIVHVAC